MSDEVPADVDVVVVSYNSGAHLRACVEPLAARSELHVFVVDNASADGCVDALSDLPLTVIARADNGGFAVGCNEGWRAGRAPYVLFLNPDAVADPDAVARLAAALRAGDGVAAVAPRIEHGDGSLAHSLRRFPSLRSTYGRALFLHRLLPHAEWTDELVRSGGAYDVAWSPDWVSGACVLVRRSALEQLDGWDERFFLFGEDVDLCRRIRDAGLDVRYVPHVTVRHVEGASAASAVTLPLLASARATYAAKHHGTFVAGLYRGGVALHGLTHAVAGRGDPGIRRAHLRAMLVALGLADDGAARLRAQGRREAHG